MAKPTQTQTVEIIATYGNVEPAAKINDLLAANPTRRIVSATPIKVDYAGGETRSAVLIVLDDKPRV